MRARGLEPPRAFAQRDLNPPRLPIPPRPRGKTITGGYNCACERRRSAARRRDRPAAGARRAAACRSASPRPHVSRLESDRRSGPQAGERTCDHRRCGGSRLLRLPRHPSGAPDRGRRLQPHGGAGHDRVDDGPPLGSRSLPGNSADRGQPHAGDREQERQGDPHRPRLPARPLDDDRGDERAHARAQPGLRPRGDAGLRQAAAHCARRSSCASCSRSRSPSGSSSWDR